MNVFFIIGNTVITPDLKEGTILAGVTRDSVMVLLREMGFQVEERDLSIDDVISAHKAGILYEVFGTGTAATISPIKELRYKDYVMEFDVDKWKTAPVIKNELNAIRYGQIADTHDWMYKI
jgi:branched-chain amino acid aminotransferase